MSDGPYQIDEKIYHFGKWWKGHEGTMIQPTDLRFLTFHQAIVNQLVIVVFLVVVFFGCLGLIWTDHFCLEFSSNLRPYKDKM